jgi:hypothetical protein
VLPFLSTGQVADQLRVPAYLIHAALRFRKFPPPQKDGTGSFVWTERDVANLEAALAATQARREARRAR